MKFRSLMAIGLAMAGAVAVLSAQGQSPLQGTSWRLVKFEGGDGKVLTPGERDRYTLEFAADGALAARIDCNRGRGTWKSASPPQLELGVMALTRAMCGKDSLHDQIVKQLPSVRSYVLKGGHLYLSLVADGGIYEFEPVAAPLKSPVGVSGQGTFTCDGSAEPIRATFYKTQPGLAVLQRGSETRIAFTVVSASGARYLGDGVSFWEAKGEATVNWAGKDLRCRRNP